MDLMELVRPELLVLVPALYLVGVGLKKAAFFADKYIPLALGLLGAVLGATWLMVFRVEGYSAAQSLLTGAVQGILCAGLSVYANQLFKQLGKTEDA